MSSSPDLPGTARCAAAMTVLGASVPISRLVLDYPVLTGQAGRYALAAAAFALIGRLRGGNRVQLDRRDWVRLALLAATGLVAFNLLLLTALRHTDPALVGTVVGGTPCTGAPGGGAVAGSAGGGALATTVPPPPRVTSRPSATSCS